MLKFRDVDGNVFAIDVVPQKGTAQPISNARGRRDSSGNLDIDKQWVRVQIPYTVRMDRLQHDAWIALWKGTDPILTASGATPAFEFNDDELFAPGWIDCTFEQPDPPLGVRVPGRQESYTVQFILEISGSDWDDNRRTA